MIRPIPTSLELALQASIDGEFPFKRIKSGEKLWYFDKRDPEAWLKV